MCTNFVLIKKPSVITLANHLSVDAESFSYSEHFAPGNPISIVAVARGQPEVRAAIWWLYLRQMSDGLKPHPEYFSVNTNYKKLDQKWEYRHSRCLIPATAFMESQDGKRPHLLEPDDGSAMAFGGLYKEWTDKVTGETVTSASIITLPGIPALENIHRKSTPLWLPDDAFERWLDPELTNPAALEDLLIPTLRCPLKATPIDKVSKRNPIGESFLVG